MNGDVSGYLTCFCWEIVKSTAGALPGDGVAGCVGGDGVELGVCVLLVLLDGDFAVSLARICGLESVESTDGAREVDVSRQEKYPVSYCDRTVLVDFFTPVG